MHPENWEQLACIVFPPDARNREQTEGQRANLSPQKKYLEYGEIQKLNRINFPHRIPTILGKGTAAFPSGAAPGARHSIPHYVLFVINYFFQ